MATEAANDIKTACNAAASAGASIASEVVNDILDTVGIKEYYAVHLTTICEGSFDRSPAAKDASVNVTRCIGGSMSLDTLFLLLVAQASPLEACS